MTSTVGREWGGAVGLVADTRGRALHTFAAGADVVVNVDAAGLSGRGRLGIVIGRTDDGIVVQHGRLKRTYSPLRAAWSTVDDWRDWQRSAAGTLATASYLAVKRSRRAGS